jgi:hypothetical protein
MRATCVALLQGPRSGPGYVVLSHHHLIDPIRPTRRHITTSSHGDLLICDAFAVREGLGDPRVVPGFHRTFRPDMPTPKTPESSTSISSRQRCRRWPSPCSNWLGTPKPPQSVSRGRPISGLPLHTFATACQFACPPVWIRPVSRPSGAFTTRFPTGRSPFPLPVITTTVTGLLCW